MSKFLIALQEGGGDSPPIASIARALAAAGHEVSALADPVLRPEIEASGVTYLPWDEAHVRTTFAADEDFARDWEPRTPLGKFKRFRDHMAFGPATGYARDVAAQIDRDRPDVVVATAIGFGVQAGAEACGVPVVPILTTSYLIAGTGGVPYGSGLMPPRNGIQHAYQGALDRMALRLWGTGAPQLNEARAAVGLPPVGHPFEQFHGAPRFLVLTSRSFDFPVRRLPANVRYTGPRLADPEWAETWSPPPGDGPLVLVGLSSTYMAQEGLFQRVADALGRLPVRGLITLGPAVEPDGIDAPPNVTVVRSAPHNQVLEHASAVITHGGHGTTIKALAAGVPVLAIPLGRDQPDNAARLEHSGAGLRLKPAAKPEEIARSIEALLTEDRFAAAARRVAEAIRAETATDLAVEELEAVAVRLPDGPQGQGHREGKCGGSGR